VFVHKALEAAHRLGCVSGNALQGLYRSVGVEPEAPVDPAIMMSDEDFFDFMERLATMGPKGRAVPIHMGKAMRCDDYGAFGLAFKSAPDLLASYTRVARFGKVVTSIANFEVTQARDAVVMTVLEGRSERLGLTMTNELALAAAVSLSREVGNADFAPAVVYLRSARPEDNTLHQAHFRCPVVFGANQDALEVKTGVASAPNRLSDAGISRFFERLLDEQLSQTPEASSLERRVLDHIKDALSEGFPTLDDIAPRVGMSGRTLQRRLSAEGLAFRDLVVQARRTLAEQLLKQTDYALAEIAFLTGFADQSTFTRAFKRWHGSTPAGYRRAGGAH
jgi:AraC-like DNA-binding protein